jgi:uncharacterized membrane protein
MLRSHHWLVCTLLTLTCGIATYAVDAEESLTDHATEHAAPRYTTLDIFGSEVSVNVSINNRRMVTGSFNDPFRERSRGFALLDRFLDPLDVGTEFHNVSPVGLNDRGEIVGIMNDARTEIAFRYTRGKVEDVSVPGANTTTARDINNRGDMVGVLQFNGVGHGYLLSGDQLTLIDGPEGATGLNVFGINDRREIVGSYEPAGTLFVTIGFLFREGAYTILRAPEATRTFPFAINNRGQIVGSYWDAASAEHGFLLWKGRYVTIDIPNNTQTRITSINDFGDIVGTYLTPSFERRAFKSNIREFLPPRRVQR